MPARQVDEVGEEAGLTGPLGPLAEDLPRGGGVPRECGDEDGDPPPRQPSAVEVEQVEAAVETEEVGL
jgi:hypothetical protein